jgi:hypothetical protein
MKHFHIKRLEKLAKHLEKGKLGHEFFNFAVLNDCVYDNDNAPIRGCGTVGCAMGECPVLFRKHWKFSENEAFGMFSPRLRKGSKHSVNGDTATFFGISIAAVCHLFHPNEQATGFFGGENLQEDATKKQVASNIRAFVKLAKRGAFDEDV